jgi:hypothetical protein
VQWIRAPPYLERAGPQLQPILQELVHRSLNTDALLLGQSSHWEGADHHLFSHLQQAKESQNRGGKGTRSVSQGTTVMGVLGE